MTLRDWRESAGLTQKELARLARVSRASISHIETERYAPSAGFAGKMARALSRELGITVHTWDIFPAQFQEVELANFQLLNPQSPMQRQELGRAV